MFLLKCTVLEQQRRALREKLENREAEQQNSSGDTAAEVRMWVKHGHCVLTKLWPFHLFLYWEARLYTTVYVLASASVIMFLLWWHRDDSVLLHLDQCDLASSELQYDCTNMWSSLNCS